ncbi:galactosamine-6-phosphate isomerase [Flagellimonas algicola]|uniref:Galactosamine-6-phosphate isomerase n=1 Tax=Flagellimonas algicola TaxID=2583815 RepID=A0ABY2WND0_9FLAO|nr:galactosamine-6-phosphate isomerase [Allomuricauda algicola]TMU56508.1 galactosamine-6-phosphate isomerase [Allomuricauda algicola]
MRIHKFCDIKKMGQQATSLVLDELTNHPKLLLCAATGNSPLPLYQGLALEAKKNPGQFAQLRIIPLDEWIGLPSLDGTCHAYLQEQLLKPLEISSKQYFAFDPWAKNLEEECSRIQALLGDQGPIDLCILGLGRNGHLGLNEPASVMQPHCHIADLTLESRQHSMLKGSSQKPIKGITLGMEDILASKRIILLVSGKGKEGAKNQFFSKKVNSSCPASFLWKHNNVDCLVAD